MARVKLDNIEVTYLSDDGACIAGIGQDARYHVWVDPATLTIKRSGRFLRFSQPKVYKNSLAYRGQEGYYDTRYLQIDSETGRSIVEQLLSAAKTYNLIEKFKQRQQEEQDRVERQAQEAGRIARIKEAGPELLEAVECFLQDFGGDYEGPTFDKARAAVRKAKEGV